MIHQRLLLASLVLCAIGCDGSLIGITPADAGLVDARNVGTCAQLGAMNQPEAITPLGVDVTTYDGFVGLAIDPTGNGTVYLGTDHSGILKSTDCGAHWIHVNSGINGAALDMGTVWNLVIDPVDPNVLYAANSAPGLAGLYKSINGGIDWVNLYVGTVIADHVEYSFAQETSIDPATHSHLLVTFHANCLAPYDPMCMGESTDSGTSWRLFRGPTQGWATNGRPFILSATTWLYSTAADGIYYTLDSGATWQLVQGAHGANHQIYRTGDNYYIGSPFGMFRSADGLNWSQILGSPPGDGLIGDGSHLFTGVANGYFVASESDDSSWRSVNAPGVTESSVYLALDSAHHLLYSVNRRSGVWRMRTE